LAKDLRRSSPEAPLSEVGGKRLFVKEIEDALLGGEIDLAVHSSKDMSVLVPEGLHIAAVLPRENPLDAVVFPVASDDFSRMAEKTHRQPDLAPRPWAISDQPLAIGHQPSAISDRQSAISHQPSAISHRPPLATIEDLVAELGQSPVVGTGSIRRTP
jgi:hypothetical protein